MKALIILTLVSAAIDALSQLREVPVDFPKKKKQYNEQSWIPNKFFEWDFGWVLDAFHQYQGWGLFLFGVSLVHFYIYFWGLFTAVVYKLGLYFHTFDSLYIYLFLALYSLVWYQIRNVFFHIVFKYPKYWKDFKWLLKR